MPISYTMDDSALTFTTVGDVDFAEGLAVLNDGMCRYEQSKPAQIRVLFDLTQSTENRSGEELKYICHVVTQKLPGARIALVVRSDLLYGLSRMFSAMAYGKVSDSQVFRSMTEAQAWLLAG